jgi:hypothetical protein
MAVLTKSGLLTIGWWVRPALALVRALRKVAPEFAAPRIDHLIDRIVDWGIKNRPAPPTPALLPATTAWLADIRGEAAAPRALVIVVKGPRGSVAIFPEDIVGKSDDELLAFIASRLDESNRPGF